MKHISPPPLPKESTMESRAAALAHVQQMDEDLKMAHVRINDLEREINRADDRMVLLMDERNRLRKEYKIVLTAFVQLATEVEVIQRQSARAGEMLKSANDLLNRVNGDEAAEATTSTPHHDRVDAAVAALEAELKGPQDDRHEA